MMPFEPWQVFSALIVLLSFALSGVAIMVSRLLSNRNLEQWAKAEMVFAFSTFVLAVFFFIMFDFGQKTAVNLMESIIEANLRNQGVNVEFDQMYPTGQHPTLIGLSELYMDEVYSCLRAICRGTYVSASPFFFAETLTKDAFMGDTGSGWGLKPITQLAMNVMNYSVFTAFIYMVFLHILRFVSAMALPVFFPLGILLRAFPPTRGAGAYVLGFVFGLYLIYPIAYLLAVNLSMNPFTCGVPEAIEPPNMCNAVSPGMAEQILAAAEANSNDVMGILEEYRNKLAGVFVNLCCLPFLAMVMTMSFILASTNLFGANLPEIGRGFVKLI